ncbi:MAG: hypothetical protein HY267_06525 [Deltaproteobacteria bacterium]|nr:hypothetical protein [Deltaproteobacteria bacterium]
MYRSRLLLVLLLAFVNACRPKTANLKEDLQLYVDKAILWTATEEQINKAIAGVRRDQFVHDELIAELLKPAVSIAWNHTQELEKYQPKAPPLQNVHREYVEAWRAHYLAMAAIADAAEKKDYIQLAKANNDLLEAQRSLVNANADLARLLHEAGIQQEKPEGEQAPSTSPQKSAL